MFKVICTEIERAQSYFATDYSFCKKEEAEAQLRDCLNKLESIQCNSKFFTIGVNYKKRQVAFHSGKHTSHRQYSIIEVESD